MKTKKLINDPKVIIEEMLEGIVAAHPKHAVHLDTAGDRTNKPEACRRDKYAAT